MLTIQLLTNATINTFNSTGAPQYVLNIPPVASGNVTIDIPANKAYDLAVIYCTETE